MERELIWSLACAISIIIMVAMYISEYMEKLKLMLKTKKMRESIIEVEIEKKYFVEGLPLTMAAAKFASPNFPDSYIIDYRYNGRTYSINSQEIFEKYEVGDNIKLKIIERLDKNMDVISFKVLFTDEFK